MGLETATYISQLVSTNPLGTDTAGQGDDHLRLIKSVLQNSFPNVNGAANPSPAEFNILVGADTTGFAAGLLAQTSAAATRSYLGLVIGTDVQAYNAATAFTDTVQSWTAQQYAAVAALTDGANIAWNLSTAQRAKVILGGNRTLDNPTNMQADGLYSLRVIQDATGGRTLSYGTAYDFTGIGGSAPTLTTTANGEDLLVFYSDGAKMYCINAVTIV